MNKLGALLEAAFKRPLSIAAAFAFFVAIGLSIADRTSSASLCAAVFIVSTLLHYFPQLESFKAIGVEAKLRKRLEEADEILGKLRALALVSGTQMYTELALAGRFQDNRFEEKRDSAARMDQVLADLGVSDAEIKKAKKDYIGIIGIDLSAVLSSVLDKGLYIKRQHIHKEQLDISKFPLGLDNPRNDEYNKNLELLKLLSSSSVEQAFTLEDYKFDDLGNLIRSKINRDCFSETELSKIDNIIEKICRIHRGCVTANTLTDEALEFLQKHPYEGEGRRELMGRIFKP